jgi:hypothetical protein
MDLRDEFISHDRAVMPPGGLSRPIIFARAE